MYFNFTIDYGQDTGHPNITRFLLVRWIFWGNPTANSHFVNTNCYIYSQVIASLYKEHENCHWCGILRSLQKANNIMHSPNYQVGDFLGAENKQLIADSAVAVSGS